MGLVVIGFGVLVLLALKLTGTWELSWGAVLAPAWVPLLIGLALHALAAPWRDRS